MKKYPVQMNLKNVSEFGGDYAGTYTIGHLVNSFIPTKSSWWYSFSEEFHDIKV